MRQGLELSVDNISKFYKQKITNPVNARRALNSFYAVSGVKSQKFIYQNSPEPLEVISEFYNSLNSAESVEEIYSQLHTICVKIGYGFTALGLPDSEKTELNIEMTDSAKKVYSLKQIISDNSQNILVKSFSDKTKKITNSPEFREIPEFNDYRCIVIPLVFQNESIGVFTAGSIFQNSEYYETVNVLCNYATLLLANIQIKEKFDSDTDNLTGLKTHREFQEKLTHAIKTAEQNEESVSVIIFDINNIAGINREFGHAKGDEIISSVARKIKKNIRGKDLAARYGGDEIAVILTQADNEKACYVARHINKVLSECCISGIGRIKTSIGVATYPKCTKDREKLLILAEQSMLISKHNGYKNGTSAVVSSQDVDFWNEVALNTLARVIAKRHSQWGVNFEDELVKRFVKAKKLPKISLDVVSSLAGAIDAKDTYTRGHSQAVSVYAEALARAANLPEKKVQRIKLAALLHDVGKIGISEAILRKPGALTDHEWEIMKQHPVIGTKKVLEPIKSLKDLIPIVKHHHERIDGCGYPDRLKEDEIPLGAKIVAIADAFHALISHRPYRKSLSMDKSLEILKSGAGTQWDKELIGKFISIAPSLVSNL